MPERNILSFLGGARTLGKSRGLARLAAEGLPKKALMAFLRESRIEEIRLFRYLDVTKRSLDNYGPDERMRLYISDRLIHLAELYAKGKEVFGSIDNFGEWLHNPSIDLQGQQPIDHIHTRKGVDELMNILGRLEHGILA